MGRLRKRHNWKARLAAGDNNEGEQKDEAKVLECDVVKGLEANANDLAYGNALSGSNVLALPSKKVDKETRNLHLPIEKKRLSKKARKRLEKIVESKKKKSKRADVLKLLAKSSVTEHEISQYDSVSRLGQVNNTGLKRKLSDEDCEKEFEVRSLVKRGRKKGKKERLRMKMKKMEEKKDVQVDESSDESDEADDEDEDEDDEKQSEKELGQKEKGMNGNEEEHHNQSQIKENMATPTSCDSSETEACEKSAIENASTVTELSVNRTKHNEQSSPLKSAETTSKPAVFVEVKRDPDVQTARLQLPILGEEQAVMEAIKQNEIVLLVGETGSGKTTQVPQFLYEAGYAVQGMIGITEPRRVAAVTMSHRVALEMSLPESEVSYQIRYEGNTTSETRVKFMTDGVLLREVEKDFLLSDYSVIVIDEAHERSVYTDILIGLLSRIVLLRKKQGNVLKLIIMSATLRVEDFTNNATLFNPTPPVVKVEARQFPVTIHFNKRTPNDYVNEAFRKVCKIHKTLPDGGILVFLTGQNEIHSLCRKLRNSFPFKRNSSPVQKNTSERKRAGINLDDYSMSARTVVIDRETEDEDVGESLAVDDDSSSEPEELHDSQVVDKPSPMYVLPLYSLLSNEKQRKVFESPPDGARFCVVATNVAETSLTIPNMKYVIDAGMVKRRYYDKTTGVSSFKITWTSQASANQRAGRAGRVGPGHCYRLYSSAVFNNDFEEFTQPDILRRPVDDLVLQMKAINIDKVVNFPFPTTPESKVLETAEKLLLELGALVAKKTKKGVLTSVITSLGRTMTKFPVSPRYAKMLCLGHQNDCLQFVVVIVAALTVHEIFSSGGGNYDGDEKKERLSNITKLRRRWAGDGVSQLLGDFMVMLRAVGAAEFSGCSPTFCQASGVRHKAMIEIRKLRVQLTNAINGVNPDCQLYVDPKMKPPLISQTTTLRQIILSCFGENVARRMSAEECADRQMKNAYECHLTEEPVFIHPTSALFPVLPEFIVFQELVETTKLYVKGVAAVEPDWFALLTPQHCSFSKPLKDPSPTFDPSEGIVKCHVTVSFGARAWCLPAQELEYPKCTEKYKWFARFLLQGQVVSKLASFTHKLLALPSTMVKSWSKLQPRTEALLRELVERDVDDKARLLAIWEKDNSYLLKAYLQWIPESTHEEFKKIWPPV